jgi:[ribosomal protein S18]-alanine N-acetyltransferase
MTGQRAGGGAAPDTGHTTGSLRGSAIALEPLDWWDIPALVHLEETLFPGDSPWNAEMFWSELAAGHHYVVHRDAAGLIDGYAGLMAVTDEAEVQTIGVRPDAQGSGLGRALLRHLLQAAGPRRVLLEVRTDNVKALALYASEGFVRLGIRRRYYQPSGADAYTMAYPG